MSVGEIVATVGLAQSTVSQHLKILAEVRFVLVEPVGNARHYRVNETCVSCFPSAADVVMGKPAPAATWRTDVVHGGVRPMAAGRSPADLTRLTGRHSKKS